MKDFDWQTDEENEQVFAGEEREAVVGRKHGRKLLFLLAMLALISAVIYWQLDRRADAQEAVFEEDVLGAFRLWRQAVAQGDEDIFNTLLVGTEPAWAAGQRNLFLSGELLSRSELDLALAIDEDGLLPVEAVVVDLSPDWNSAEITFQQVYNLIDHPVQTLSDPQQLRLVHSLMMRRSADRWFVAQPPDDYWGERQTLENDLLIVNYPERDEEMARQLYGDLTAELAAYCQTLSRGLCLEQGPIELRLDTVASPDRWRGWETTLVDGRIFYMPAPSLIGLPTDEAGYDLVYQHYLGPVLDIYTSWVDTPIPLPDQELQVICYPPESRVPRLIRFTSPQDWVVDLPSAAFRYLSPTASDDGLVLQHYLPGEDSSQLRVTLWQNGKGETVFNDTFSHLMLYPVGWGGPTVRPHLLLHGYDQFPTTTSYRWLDMSDCDGGGCEERAIAGYPVWSPDGRFTILRIGDTLFLGDQDAGSEREIGPGLAPFWLNPDQYGYLRYLTESETDLQSGRMELVIADRRTEGERRLLTTDDFSPEVQSYISYVTLNPVNPLELFVALRSFTERQEVKIFSLKLQHEGDEWDVEELAQLFSLDSATVGYPSLSVPNGFVPFVVSNNGRWLSASHLSPDEPDRWDIYAHNTELDQTFEYTVDYPSGQFIHPYYDWSKDSNWLVIVDKDYLRLIAPEYGYERLISHDLSTCSHVAWVDPVP